ncbi:hypothetical protein CDL15_Pgr006365 [Punica granatum]|uniref:Uncharacterized protein n=1 Tax=Punica granatum TaxID=22663 RepID=A0A218VU18_PUNGR|nr:hypothetical protein CDL15_Pgr006365 [Punica granatum]
MTRSVPTSLAGVTHYGDLGANFNQGGPSVRRLPRLCWRELQPGMPQCTSLAEVVLVRTSTGDAPVYVAWKSCASANFNWGCPSCQHPILAHRLQRRTSNRSSGHYSRLGNRRRIDGHRVMNNRRRAGFIRKVEESSRRNLQAKNPENIETSTAALFITESPEHRKVSDMEL